MISVGSLNAHATKYSPVNAYWLGRAAKLIYLEDTQDLALEEESAVEKIENQMKNWGFDRVHFMNFDDTQVVVAANDEAVVVVFRGTTNLRDWMTNVKTRLVEGPAGRVHCGFFTGLHYAWDEIKRKIKEFDSNNQPILVTGHSLGAALATLAAATLKVEGLPVNGLYTFGSPRVGDHAFAEFFEKEFAGRAFRFVNNNDIVTRVAPRAMQYSHVGKFLYFDVMGNLKAEPSYWNQFLDSMQGKMEDFLKPSLDSIKDHDMGTYEKYLLKNIDKYLD